MKADPFLGFSLPHLMGDSMMNFLSRKCQVIFVFFHGKRPAYVKLLSVVGPLDEDWVVHENRLLEEQVGFKGYDTQWWKAKVCSSSRF